MMEVKQHTTPMEFNDLVTSSNDLNNSLGSPLRETDRDQLEQLEDVAMDKVELLPNLKSTLVEEEDILKTDEPITNGAIISSSVIGSTVLTSSLPPTAIDLEDVELDMATAITPELEDELLADDESDVVDKLLAEVVPASKITLNSDLVEAESVELEKNIEKPATNNVDSLRDTGDDLDTLLSKINNIVEDSNVPTAAQKEEAAAEEVAAEKDAAEEGAAEEDAAEENATEEDAAESEQVVAAADKVIITETDTKEAPTDDSVILLEDSVIEEHIETELNVPATEVAKDTNEVQNVETATEVAAKPLAQLELPEAAVDSCKEDDEVIPMEQDEVISGSDQMILDVDLDANHQVEPVKPDGSLTDLEPAQEDAASSPKCEPVVEKIEEENVEDKVTANKQDSLLPATEETKVDLVTADEKDSCQVVESTEPLPIVEDAAQSTETLPIDATDTAVTSTDAAPTDKVDTMMTESTVDDLTKSDEVPKTDAEAVKEEKQVETPKEEATTTSKSPPTSINLDGEDSDDDIVFFCEKSKSSDSNKEQAKSVDKDLMQNETETKIDTPPPEKKLKEDDDDVVLLDDDSNDVAEVAPNATATLPLEPEPIKMETDDVERKTANADLPSTNLENEVKEATENKILENKDSGISEENSDKLLVDDNSDNARDKFGDAEVAEKQPAEEEEAKPRAQKSADAEESNSNCSSSSNLLQESKAVASSEGGEEDNDLCNDDDDDAADNDCEAMAEVEIIETEELDEESKEAEIECDSKSVDKDAPPAKRMRLSTADDDEESSKLSFDKTVTEDSSMQEDIKPKTETDAESAIVEDMDSKVIKTEGEKTSNKRAHDDSLLEEDSVDKKESEFKKLKTEDPLLTDEKQKIEIRDEEVDDSKSDIIEIKDSKEDEDISTIAPSTKEETVAEEVSMVPIVKAVPSHIPVPLYPPPAFEDPAPKFSYDFLKRFKKTLDKLTKIDLEELVMQKIAEAIIHKSEFGEMRELIEKQEKTIAAHRTKITELSKQFRDLEMVHNRVLKDIETKNSQFLMPVKITRAVGLQVFIPLKKNSDPVSNAAANSVSVSSPQQTTQQSPYRSSGNSSGPPPLTSPLRQSNSIDSSSSTATSSSSQQQRSSNSVLASAGAAASINSRRGCVQKITPQRPMENASLTTSQSAASTTTTSYRIVQSQATASQQIPAKLLNKSASASAIAQMRNRFSGGNSSTVMQPQQQTGRQQPSPTNNVRKVVQAPLATVKQPTSSTIAQQFRRSEPTAQTSISPASTSDTYMSSTHQLPTGLPSVSITPAKPKDKSVIDLTDEDDAPTSVTPTSTAIRQRPTNTPPNSGGTSGSSNYLLNKVTTSNVRVPPVGASNQPKTVARQQVSNLYGSKSNGNSPIPTNISTPPGTSITRIQVNANMQRIKYGHPAPLPPTPAQNLHPAWKLPPPRPTIRISNLDNGIVISWTVEESMDRHADCVSYQIYAYQETSGPPLIDSWRHVGDVKAMLLPMAVTLTQFQEGQRYFFAVRAVDVHHRVGPFSVPKTWS